MKLFLILIFISFGYVECKNSQVSASTTSPTQKSLDQTQKQWLMQIETYFNKNLNSLKSDFVQIDGKGHTSAGKIFLKRKAGLAKLYYNPPNPNIIRIADHHAFHYDRDLQDQSEIPIYDSPLAFLLNKTINLEQSLKLVSFNETNDLIRVIFCKKDNLNEGYVQLVFQKQPLLTLMSWTILENLDGSGKTVTLLLKNPNFNASIPKQEFKQFELLQQ